ncbi:MAG: hypothetical protein QXZ36_03730 [Thermoproteota archaeon]
MIDPILQKLDDIDYEDLNWKFGPPSLVCRDYTKDRIIYVAGDFTKIDYWRECRKLLPNGEGGVMFYRHKSFHATLTIGKHSYYILHVSCINELITARRRVAEFMAEWCNENGRFIMLDDKPCKSADEILQAMPVTPPRISRWIAQFGIQDYQYVTDALHELLEPSSLPKSSIHYQQVTADSNTAGEQVDIDSAYVQFIERLGTWTPYFRLTGKEKRKVIRGKTFVWGGLELVDLKRGSVDEFMDGAMQQLWCNKRNRLISVGALMSGIDKCEGISCLRYRDGKIEEFPAKFKIDRRTRGGLAGMTARSALRQLGDLIWNLSGGVKAVLTDSFISTSDFPRQVLDLLGIRYKFVAEGTLEILAPCCYRIGAKKTLNFEQFRDVFLDERIVQHFGEEDVFDDGGEVRLDALQVVLHLDDDTFDAVLSEIARMAENEKEVEGLVERLLKKARQRYVKAKKTKKRWIREITSTEVQDERDYSATETSTAR